MGIPPPATFLALAALVWASAPAWSAQAGDPAEAIYALIRKSTVMIQPDASRPGTFGSGFVVRPGVVATCAHVVKGLKSGVVRVVGVPERHRIDAVLAVDPLHDVALVSVATLDAPPLPLATVYDLKVGQRVYAIGNPAYRGEVYEGTLSDGRVTAMRMADLVTHAPDILRADAIQTNVAITHGNSGGPLVNDEGEVVGLTGSGVEAQPGVTVAGLSFAVPVKHVLELMPDFKAAHYRFYGRVLISQARSDGLLGSDAGKPDLLLRACALAVYRGRHLERMLAAPVARDDGSALASLVDQAIERFVAERYLDSDRAAAALAYLDGIAPMAALTTHAGTVRALRSHVLGHMPTSPELQKAPPASVLSTRP